MDSNSFSTMKSTQMYSNGKPSANDLQGLQGLVNGAVDGTTFRVSSQLALLPGATNNLVARAQQAMLGGQNSSLANRLNSFISSPRFNQSAQRLKAVINRTITQYTRLANRQFLNYLETTPINRLSVDSTTGQRIPIQQYMAQQVISQFGASMAALAKAFPTVANGTIVSNGVISTDPAVQQAFAKQLQSAIAVVNYQLASNLAVFKGASQALGSQLQQAFFGSDQSSTGTTGSGTAGTASASTAGSVSTGDPSVSMGAGTTGTVTAAALPALGVGTGTTGIGGLGGTGTTSLFSALSGIPTTNFSSFFPAVNSAFNNTFQNVSGMLGSFFNLPATGTTTGLPIDIRSPSIGGPVFFGFGNGFNNGFGSGFLGFGQSPISQNQFFGSSFNNGFFGLTAAQNQLFGFNPANFTGFGGSSALTGTGIGTGTTGTGTGIGTGTIGTGITGTGITGIGTSPTSAV